MTKKSKILKSDHQFFLFPRFTDMENSKVENGVFLDRSSRATRGKR